MLFFLPIRMRHASYPGGVYIMFLKCCLRSFNCYTYFLLTRIEHGSLFMFAVPYPFTS